MDQALKTHLEAMENRLQIRVDGVEARLREHTETVETRLLSEFWKWARSSDIKNSPARCDNFRYGVTISVMDERLTAVEERMSELERRRT